MPENNVPNPLAKNPSFYTHKVFAAVGIILISVIIIGSGIWYFYVGRFSTLQSESVINQPVPFADKVEFIPRKIATASSSKLVTTTWKVYKKKAYSFEYPSDFSAASDYGAGVRLASSDVSPKKAGPIEKITAGTELEVSSYPVEDSQPKSIDNWDKLGYSTTPQYIQVAGIKAVKIVQYNPYTHQNEIDILFFKNNVKYMISEYLPVTVNDINSSIIDAVAATFKFL